MARGFLAGAATGGLVGVVALAALSLAVPLAPQGHDALSVGLPIGSEFGRGGDVAPTLPAPGAVSQRDAATRAAMPAPRDEAARVADDTMRPDLQPTDRMPAQPVPDTIDDAPGLALRGAAPATVTGPIPRPAVRATQDGLPRIAPPDDAPMDRAPAMPAPALDLSLPPDLTDLRRMERN
ncbi:hypothetical protein [Paracoccus sp. Ld10]|uniref:hypothetical protein n=1 Tax=Paracoccus sp. Ld10 TaxID=649158 RepID=UPI00386B5FCA